MSMVFEGEERIEAPRQVVWDALNDVGLLRDCIPGCEELTERPDGGIDALVVLKVGPVKAKFRGDITIAVSEAPSHYGLAGEGKGGAAGFAKGGADIHLQEAGADRTLMSYRAEVVIGGKLAQLGSRLIRGTADKLTKQFFARFNELASDRVAGAEQ
jgi:hypothetical protein